MASQLTIATICLVLGVIAAEGSSAARSRFQRKLIQVSKRIPYKVTMRMAVENKTPYWLLNPHVTLASGVITIPPAQIAPGGTGVMATRKTSGTATGTFGVVSWEIKEKSRRVVVMWSVPYDFNLYSSYLAVGITKQNAEYDDSWPNLMYYESSNEQLGFNRQEYYYNTPTVIWVYDGLKISGNMTTAYNAEVKVWVETLN